MPHRQLTAPVAAGAALSRPQLEVEVHSPLGLELYRWGSMMMMMMLIMMMITIVMMMMMIMYMMMIALPRLTDDGWMC